MTENTSTNESWGATNESRNGHDRTNKDELEVSRIAKAQAGLLRMIAQAVSTELLADRRRGE